MSCNLKDVKVIGLIKGLKNGTGILPTVLNKRITFATNMASIVMAIPKATVGKLLDKGRKTILDRLKEGDVTDEQFRTLLVSEIDEIKSKLDGIARANLLASISLFKEGILYLYKVLDMKTREDIITDYGLERKDGKDNREVSMAASPTSVQPAYLSKEMKCLSLTEDTSTFRCKKSI